MNYKTFLSILLSVLICSGASGAMLYYGFNPQAKIKVVKFEEIDTDTADSAKQKFNSISIKLSDLERRVNYYVQEKARKEQEAANNKKQD